MINTIMDINLNMESIIIYYIVNCLRKVTHLPIKSNTENISFTRFAHEGLLNPFLFVNESN